MNGHRQHAHELIDSLPESQLSALVGLLETIVVPAGDSEPLTPAESRGVAEADEWLKHNEPIPHEEILAEFGLTMSDWDRMADEPLPEEVLHRNG